MKAFFQFAFTLIAVALCSVLSANLFGTEAGIGTMFMFAFIDATRARAAFERIQDVAAKLNTVFGADLIVNQDYFLSEQEIDNNTSTYTFQTWQKVIDTNIAQFPLQKGVNDNDAFVGIAGQLTIDNRVSGQSNVVPQTYVNVNHFTAANTGDAQDLWSFYNATWSLQIGRTVFIPGMSTRDFMYVPETQQSLATNLSEYTGSKLFEFDPYPVLSGRADNKLQLEVPLYAGWAGAALTGQNIVGFRMNGVTIQNGAGFVKFFTGGESIDRWVKIYEQAGGKAQQYDASFAKP